MWADLRGSCVESDADREIRIVGIDQLLCIFRLNPLPNPLP